MKLLNKKFIIATLIASTISISSIVDNNFVQAENLNNNQKQTQQNDQRRHHQPPKFDVNKIAKEVAEDYGVKESEVLKALNDKRHLDDIYHAALLAKISGKSFQKVISMKTDWFDVEKSLGINEDQIHNAREEMLIRDISINASISEDRVKKLLDDHYHPRDISIAGRLAKASNKDIQAVLDMKKINQRWFDIAKVLGVSEELVKPHGHFEEDDQAPPPPEEN
ncbi:MAG: hypothetical protein IJ728_03095 [Selenomonadaceae bacterium]|nr:hypothetical protein [Selenomonadaceae bacterium]